LAKEPLVEAPERDIAYGRYYLYSAAIRLRPLALSSSVDSCICEPTEVWCDLVAGFTAAYDKSSNKLFERHLHVGNGKRDITDKGQSVMSPLSSLALHAARELGIDRERVLAVVAG